MNEYTDSRGNRFTIHRNKSYHRDVPTTIQVILDLAMQYGIRITVFLGADTFQSFSLHIQENEVIPEPLLSLLIENKFITIDNPKSKFYRKVWSKSFGI